MLLGLLALAEHDPGGAIEELLEGVCVVGLLACVDRLTDDDVPAFEEGAGTGATRSRVAVVVPVDALGHASLRAEG